MQSESNLPIFQTGDALPRALGALNYLGTEVYDDKRLGVKFRYGCEITKADVYLYDLGQASIPSDLRSDEVMQFFQQACGEIIALAERGMYLDLETRA